jgi:hypothetical protein
MKFVDFILNLDRRIIYAIVAVLVAFPLFKPIPLPIVPTPETHGVFDKIDALPAGSSILIAADFDPASKPELLPLLHAVLAQCFKKGVKPHLLTLWAAGPGLMQTAIEDEARRFDKVSGEDFVFLGFRYGTLAVILGMDSNITSTFGTDFYGKRTASMPIYQDVHKISDMKYILDIAAGATVEIWITYASQPERVPMGASVTAVSATQYYPYLQAEQLSGIVGGMKGSAEYEKLVDMEQVLGRIPDATRGMAAQSFVHVFIVLSIILANICYFIWIKRERAKRRAA